MVIENVDPGETESAASEAEILNKIGILANGTEPYKKLQKNPSGFCLECKGKIVKERLELFPNCNHCAKCQGEIDKRTGRGAPYRNTVPISVVFAKIEDEEEDGDGKIKESNVNSEDLPADLNHALKVYKRDSKGDSED